VGPRAGLDDLEKKEILDPTGTLIHRICMIKCYLVLKQETE
jgi:hypothetical protein